MEKEPQKRDRSIPPGRDDLVFWILFYSAADSRKLSVSDEQRLELLVLTDYEDLIVGRSSGLLLVEIFCSVYSAQHSVSPEKSWMRKSDW